MRRTAYGLASRFRKAAVVRYALASIGALAVDVAVFLALLAVGLAAPAASAFGYAAGIVAHWLLSSRKVFAEGVAPRGAARTRQKVLFLVSALVGLAITIAVVGLGTALQSDPRLAKLAAIATSFVATWMLRKHLVFRA